MIKQSSQNTSSSSQANAVRSEMLHLLNLTNQSKTWSLPPELWSTVFQHACPTPDILLEEHFQTPPFHLVLRLVSTLWCDIVQSTPQLWTNVIFPMLCAENVDIKGRYLKLCLESSGGLPLTLSFQFDQELRDVGSFISPTVDTTLELVTHRVRALRLSRPPRSWLENLIPKMCQLATIHFDNPQIDLWYPRDETLYFPKAANINQIRMSTPGLLYFSLDCVTSSVTHVDLLNCPFDFIMEILLRCPNLIDFRCSCPLTASKIKNPRTMLTFPFVLRHLSTFSWSTNRTFSNDISQWDTALFERIYFPALKRFNWRIGEYLLDNTPLALPLSRFPKTLATLELIGVGFYRPARGPILSHFLPCVGVTQLRLLHCREDSVEQALSALLHGTDRSNTLFPELTSLVIAYPIAERLPIEVDDIPVELRRPPPPVFGPESGHKVVQMLQSRIGLMDEFTLTVERAHLTLRWDDEVWDALGKLKQDGLNLTIIEYGQRIII